MKIPQLLLVLFTLILLASCAKQPTPKPVEPTLVGQWMMYLSIDSTTGKTETKAQSYLDFSPLMFSPDYPPPGDVIMKIIYTDSTKTGLQISGHTINNGFDLGFSIPSYHHLVMLGGMWTLADDPPWGEYFYECLITAYSYSFDPQSRLLINGLGRTVVFTRD